MRTNVQEYDIELEQPAGADEPEGHRDRKAQGEQNDGHNVGDALVHLESGIVGKCRRIDDKAGEQISCLALFFFFFPPSLHEFFTVMEKRTRP